MTQNSINTANSVVQVVSAVRTTTVASAVVMPFDNTQPVKTEGTEVLTATISPRNASNILHIKYSSFGSCGAGLTYCIALFQDALTGSLAATATSGAAAEIVSNYTLNHTKTASVTVPITFKIRVGPSAAGSVWVNGDSAGVKFAGKASTTLEIWEVLP